MGLLNRQPSRVRAIKQRLYELIDRATSEYLSAPNFALNTDVVSAINGAPDPGYAATKACKRIKGRMVLKNPRVQQLALQLLENCVRSCGEPFHRELAKSELFVELLHMADRSSWCTAQLQMQVLALLQEWAYVLKPAQFSNAYSKLKARGLPFPPRGTGAPTFEPYPGLSPPPPGHPHPYPHPPPGYGHPGAGPPPPPDAAAAVGPPQLLSPTQPPAKLREDLAVAGNTVSLLQEMLDGVPQDNFGAAKEDYVMDMVAQCREMKERLARLVSRLNDESLMATALQLNDDAQAALDRHADMVAVAEGRRRPPPPPQPAAPIASAAAAAPSPEPARAVPAAAAKPPPPLLDLLSLDNWGPSQPAPAYPPVSAAPAMAPAGSGSQDPFALAPPPVAPTPAPAVSNNPFAPQPPAPAAAPAAVPPPFPEQAPAAVPDNPFFSDNAFAAAATPTPAAQPSYPPPAWAAAAPSPAAAPPPEATGNPFAAPAPAAEAQSVVPPPQRPPPDSPLQPAGSFGYPAVQSPVGSAGAPLYPGTAPYPGAPTTYSSPFPLGPAGTPPPISPGPYGRPLSDAFGDLVRLAPKEEPTPPPPRGTPMRTAAGLSPEPGDSASKASALSAFDAFDELLTDRGSGTPSRTTSVT